MLTPPIQNTASGLRSYVLRQGRLTKAQAQALDQHWGKYGVESNSPLDLNHLFGRFKSDKVIEIGFGMGHSLTEMAKNYQDWDFLGIEVFEPGVGSLLKLIDELALANIRVLRNDAVYILQSLIKPESIDRVHIFFPDPWPKKRHHKRRLIQLPFVNLLASRLKPGGILHIATDWLPYAEDIVEVVKSSDQLENTQKDNPPFSPRPEYRPTTKFERRGQALGHQVYDLIYQRVTQL